MNHLQMNLSVSKQWSFAWLLGIIAFLIVIAWPEKAYPNQTQDDDPIASTAEAAMTDERIVEAVERKAAIDGIDTTDFQPFSTTGILTLDGSVSSLGDKLHLRRIASRVRGVRGIVNKLKVRPSQLSDSEIRSAVLDQLTLNTATDAQEISVLVENGQVTLSGNIESLAEKQLVVNVASELLGVRAIESKLEINYPEQRADLEIEKEIVERLQYDVWIDPHSLEVEVKSGAVQLRGTVATVDLKDRLSILALSAGVQSVNTDQVQVDPSLAVVPTRQQPSARLDFQIRDALVQSIRLDPRVDLRELDIEIDNGIVLLKGSVGDFQSKRAAADTARNVLGVSKVIDQLEIENSLTVADAAIQDRLNKVFNRTSTLKYDGIKSEVDAGIVNLSGTVPSQYQRRRAESLAHSLAGVLGVNNGIVVENQGGPRSDFEIGLDIERGMRWSPYLNITKLKYSVTEGVVTFTGVAANQQSLDLARTIAIDAGARDIIATDVRFE